MSPVTSSNIAAIGHDSAKNELHILFKDGAHYIYSDFTPERHAVFCAAESIGKHFHAHIKGRFPYRKHEPGSV